jgi:hypothetical protein|tara:strand:- start:469 stop:642 length:174 start_codon:yes stop_codon:yes gene_type:complete
VNPEGIEIQPKEDGAPEATGFPPSCMICPEQITVSLPAEIVFTETTIVSIRIVEIDE